MSDITIIIPSYNRGKYIAEALDSVLMQKTSYTYEIIVADDCSTDNTSEIVKKYQQENPNLITFLSSENNQKLYKNIIRAYAMLKSNYFCVLDPDDFWIDDKKIQKALDYLEIHKDYTIYATGTIQQNFDGTRVPFINHKLTDSTFVDYLNGKAVLGCTLGGVFRNVVFKNGLPEKLTNINFNFSEASFRGDSFRNIIHLHEGKAHFEPDLDGVYRITEDGLWAGSSQIKQLLLNCQFFVDIYNYFNQENEELLLIAYKLYQKLSVISLKELDFSDDKYKKELEQYKQLKEIFVEKEEKFQTNFYGRLKLKYKIFYSIYKWLSKKLKRKGII